VGSGLGSGVGSGVGVKNISGTTLGVDLLFGSDFGIGICMVYLLSVLRKALYLSFVVRKTKSH
jgi:hypothetical protein